MQVSLTKNTLTPELERMLREVKNPKVLFQAGAKAVQVAISKHLKELQARGNVKGWPQQHFFAGSATAVEKNVGIARVDGKGAEITIADPRFVHRIVGGQVTAKRGKYLAIPLTADAYKLSGKGSLRNSMPGLRVIKFKRGLFLCKEVGEKRGGGKGALINLRIIPMFKLVRTVTHRAHPDELPKEERLSEAGREAMLKAANLLLKAD